MKVDKSLLEKYHSGRCTASERASVEAWLSSDEWPEESMMPAPGESFLTPPNLKSRELKIWQRPYARVGIAATVLCTLGLMIYGYLHHDPLVPTDKVVQNTFYRTTNGKKAQVKLADGTEVIINAASELSVPIQFTDSSRVVHLKGEAYFKVAKDKKRPFTIIADLGKVTVLGTEFNLKAYANEATTLDVQEGKVSFSSLKDEKQALILLAGERATLHPQTGAVQRELGHAGINNLWKDGGINLENVSLTEIAKIIERRFDFQVDIPDHTLAKQHYSGSFKDLKLTSLLEELSFVLGCKYSIKDKQIKFYK